MKRIVNPSAILCLLVIFAFIACSKNDAIKELYTSGKTTHKISKVHIAEALHLKFLSLWITTIF